MENLQIIEVSDSGQTSKESLIDTASLILSKLKTTSKFPAAKIWTGGNTVRVYTGYKSEYIDIAASGITTSRKNMSWSQLIDPILYDLSK